MHTKDPPGVQRSRWQNLPAPLPKGAGGEDICGRPLWGGRGSGEDLADFPGLIGGLARKDPAKMQPMQRALPEFDARGDHAIAAPVGGARDGLVAKLRFEV